MTKLSPIVSLAVGLIAVAKREMFVSGRCFGLGDYKTCSIALNTAKTRSTHSSCQSSGGRSHRQMRETVLPG